MPTGVYVFGLLNVAMVDQVYSSIHRLYNIIEHGLQVGEKPNITKGDRRYQMRKSKSKDYDCLFRPALDEPAPSYAHSVQAINKHDLELCKFVLAHVEFCMHAGHE